MAHQYIVAALCVCILVDNMWPPTCSTQYGPINNGISARTVRRSALVSYNHALHSSLERV